jgi:hypothetical protein
MLPAMWCRLWLQQRHHAECARLQSLPLVEGDQRDHQSEESDDEGSGRNRPQDSNGQWDLALPGPGGSLKALTKTVAHAISIRLTSPLGKWSSAVGVVLVRRASRG